MAYALVVMQPQLPDLGAITDYRPKVPLRIYTADHVLIGEFGEERLIDLVREQRRQPLARISENVIQAVQDWIGSAEQPDDVTLVLARVQ